MDSSLDFFRDEVKNGFYVSTTMKQAWASGLTVLMEVDRICEKYNIKYFAEWGTLLGAVRHGGFVPWDDDIDICMFRKDYEKFIKVFKKEVPKEYNIHDFRNKENHWLFLSRLVDNDVMRFDEDYLKNHNNFPWIGGVDIFFKDYLYNDDSEELKRDKEVLTIIAIADGIINGKLSDTAIELKVNELKIKYNFNFNENGSKREKAVSLYELAEKLMSNVQSREADRVGQVFPWILKKGPKAGENKHLYDKIVRLPFENTTIPVPAEYNKVLSSRYGNYMEIHKATAGHEYPFFEKQREDIESVSGVSFNKFSFEKSMLDRCNIEKKQGLKETSVEFYDELKILMNEAINMLNYGNFEDFVQCINSAQQLAVDYGTLVEQVKGENNKSAENVVCVLQEYCDMLWELYQKVNGGEKNIGHENIDTVLLKLQDAINCNIIDRREVLFLTIGKKEWKTLESIYEIEKKNDNTDIYVVPLPLIKKDLFGILDMSVTTNTDDIVSKTILTDWRIYDITLHCPNIVYIQNPYDGTNPCYTVPPMFYAENIRKYTEQLIYVPIAKTSEFGNDDYTDHYNLKQYLFTPGVVYADSIIVQSENIKEQYTNELTVFAGEETHDYWINKIIIDESVFSDNYKKDNSYEVLYCIGINGLLDRKDTLLTSIKDNLDGFDNKGVNVTITLYPEDRSQWEKLDLALSKEVFNIIDTAIESNKHKYISFKAEDVDNMVNKYDEYVGSPSPFVPVFELKRKPVSFK